MKIAGDIPSGILEFPLRSIPNAKQCAEIFRSTKKRKLTIDNLEFKSSRGCFEMLQVRNLRISTTFEKFNK